jgi:hypothetical protein
LQRLIAPAALRQRRSEPVVDIWHIGFAMPEGELSLSAPKVWP